MKRTLAIFATLLMSSVVILAAASPSLAARAKELDRSPKSIEMPNLEQDPGLYFLFAEQAEAMGDSEAVLKYLRKALELDPTSAYLNTRVATLLARNRKMADALIMARNATLFDPTYEDAYTLLGKIYTITGDRDRAIESYNRALELKPDEADLYVFIGSLQASQKMYAEAEKTFLKMISQFPEERDGYFYLGRVYVEDKKFDKALEIFNTLLEKRPDAAAQAHVELGAIYILQKKYTEAENHLREAVKLDQFNFGARLSLAQVLAAQKKYDESYQVFEELSKLAPSNLGIQIKMALILTEQKQFDKAKDILDKILERKPGWDQVRYQLGLVLREQGKLERAEDEFSQIRKGQPTYVRSRVMLAIMFLRSKNLDKAIRYIDEALEEDANDPELLHIKGSILEELYRYTDARNAYNKGLEIESGNMRIRYSLGNVLEKSAYRSRGLEEMEKILTENPEDASALNFIGYTLAVSGKDMDKAEKLIRRAVQLKPDDGYIADSLAYILFRKGDLEGALALLEKSIANVKHDPIIAEHLGDVLLAQGKKEDAIKAYQKSLKENPENLIVQEKLRRLEQEIAPQDK